jgi:hypothetical protein
MLVKEYNIKIKKEPKGRMSRRGFTFKLRRCLSGDIFEGLVK